MENEHEQIINTIRDKRCTSCGMTGDITCWYGDGICGEHNVGWDNDDDNRRIARQIIDQMENENERFAVNTALHNVMNELAEYPRTNATQRIMNTLGDAIDTVGIQPVERCAYCDNVASQTCDVCDASVCIDHAQHGHGGIKSYA